MSLDVVVGGSGEQECTLCLWPKRKMPHKTILSTAKGNTKIKQEEGKRVTFRFLALFTMTDAIWPPFHPLIL